MKERLLIIDINPYGALIDTVKWIEYLKKNWNITLICFATKNGEKVQVDGFNIIQLKNFKLRQLKAIYFLVYTIFYILFYTGKTMVVYFPTCEIYKRLFPWKKMLMDVRTMSVVSDKSRRNSFNERIKNASLYFDKVTAISEGIAHQIGRKDIEILPLGSDVISSTKKDYESCINVLYVGTFSNRNIEKTILGVIKYHKKYPEVPINYKIIGYGVDGEEELFTSLISSHHAQDYIELVGKVPHSELKLFFDKTNVGFSFIPITDYYDYQPPTKTYEYCLSGIYCIATSTVINRQLINEKNGVLIQDTDDSIVEGLEKYWHIRRSLNSDIIAQSLRNCTWKCIIENNLIQILQKM